MTERIVPHNRDAERAVLGSLLIGGDFKLCNLTPADFFDEGYAAIYAACQKLADKGVSVDPVTLAQMLSDMGKLESTGGVANLSSLVANCASPLDMGYHADIVKRHSISRQLISAGEKIAALGYQPGNNGDSLSQADDLLVSLRKKAGTTHVIGPEERMALLGERYEKLFISDSVAVPSGLTDLDRELGGGFYNGDLIIVGARSGVGKTTILQCIANNMSLKHNVLFCSGEMSVEALSDRDVAGLLGKRVNEIRLGGFDGDTYADLTGRVMESLKARRIYYFDRTLTVASITQTALGVQTRHGLDILIVDYLGLLADEGGENQNIRLGNISRKLKGLARELDIPVIAAHQLSRAPELRGADDKRPNLSDLRESGHIEEDADLVLMLYREDYYTDTTSKETEIIIRKHRQGRANRVVKVYFDEAHQMYRDLVWQGDQQAIDK